MSYINEDLLPEGIIRCPKCERQYPDGCEQEVSILKRGKCITCVVKDPNEPKIDMNPYEFKVSKNDNV